MPSSTTIRSSVRLRSLHPEAGRCRRRAARRPPPRRRFAGSFVTQSGTQLLLAGQPFRFGGANIEWLGVAGYGPADPAGPHYPSHFEVDDALATAQRAGRDGRPQPDDGRLGRLRACIEPTLGQFNEAAFERIDYALASARAHGIKIIATIVGDDALEGGSGCVYLRWRGISQPDCSLINMAPFWTDPTVIGDVEEHMQALLDHVNVYTHVAYKNDPTILGWDLLNGGGSPAAWTRQIVGFVRGIDSHHLILSGYGNAGIKGVGACVSFIYPHWHMPLSFVKPWIDACRAPASRSSPTSTAGTGRTTRRCASSSASSTRSGGRRDRRRRVLGAAGARRRPRVDADPRRHAPTRPPRGRRERPVVGAVLPRASGHSSPPRPTCRACQAIRRHNYAMRGIAAPRHAIPPAPHITSVQQRRLYWRGSAGAASYSIQRAVRRERPVGHVCTALRHRRSTASRPRRGRLVPRDRLQPRREAKPPVAGGPQLG